MERPSLSEDARLVRELQLGAKRINYRGDVSYLLRRESDAWTRERFDRAVLELARVNSVRASRDTMARVGELHPRCRARHSVNGIRGGMTSRLGLGRVSLLERTRGVMPWSSLTWSVT